MGKLANLIYMIDLLNTGNVYSVKKLSQKIGVTERMIRYYKDEICKSGINVETFKGPNGGYFVLHEGNSYLTLNKYDIKLLNYIFEFLEDNKFIYLEKYFELINKIKQINSINEDRNSFLSIMDMNTFVDKKESIIDEKIKKSQKIEIVYRDIDKKTTRRVIYPLQMFKYKNSYYVTAYCELRKDIRHFEINRILSII